MGVRHITISAFKGNQASVRVFEKNGFVLTRTVENCAKARGEVYTLDFLEWHAQP